MVELKSLIKMNLFLNFVPKYGYNGYEIVRDVFDKKQVSLDDNPHCPICDSKDIILLKGDGYNIYGDDAIGIICNTCKKSIWI